MKGTEKFLFHRLLKPNFVGDLMIKDLINIAAIQIIISSFRRRCHAQRELRSKVFHNPLVRGGRRMMCFVINDRIKIVRWKCLIIFWPAHSLNRCKEKILFCFSIFSGEQAHSNRVCKHPLKRFEGLLCDLTAMHQKEDSLKSQLTHSESWSKGFSCTCSRN